MSVASDNCAIKFIEAVFKKFAPVSRGGKKGGKEAAHLQHTNRFHSASLLQPKKVINTQFFFNLTGYPKFGTNVSRWPKTVFFWFILCSLSINKASRYLTLSGKVTLIGCCNANYMPKVNIFEVLQEALLAAQFVIPDATLCTNFFAYGVCHVSRLTFFVMSLC